MSEDEWEDLQGKFSLSNKPSRAVLYIEGPPAGVDLLIEYVKVTKVSGYLSERSMWN